MNNFNDYYDFMIGNGMISSSEKNDENKDNMKNEKMFFDNNTFVNNFMYNNKMNQLYKADEGFIKGNMFVNLYDPYKKYKPYNIISVSEKNDLLNQIRMYNFAVTDLSFYLDVNPKNSERMISIYNDYVKKYRDLVNKYEIKYGPICKDFIMPSTDYIWNNSPWPWEGEK